MFYLASEHGINCRYGVFPSWLWPWIVFNTNPPRFPKWIRQHTNRFLPYKLSELSLGKVLKIWNLKSSDLPHNIVARVEYGTTYYRWRDIQVAAMRVHGGAKGLGRFMLKRCWRSRGYLDRVFRSSIHTTSQTTSQLSNKNGESSRSVQTSRTANDNATFSLMSNQNSIFSQRSSEENERRRTRDLSSRQNDHQVLSEQSQTAVNNTRQLIDIIHQIQPVTRRYARDSNGETRESPTEDAPGYSRGHNDTSRIINLQVSSSESSMESNH
ncbi:uncharacterized protein LOC124439140 [Xenia sp. Carnegie-2017]|uniref:uncharacterized protein LOC124439140 n=1 Tax=Xenia sp. Carnegie-2017 TaxID=2897299 RepID=UPI001F03E952|nr:uncharacterized protein LOC124439140 [Xenia sp. Carnegie-2017]